MSRSAKKDTYVTAQNVGEFDDKTKAITNALDELMKLQKNVHSLPKGQQYVIGRRAVGRNEVRSLKAEVAQSIRNLKKDFVANKGKKRTATRRSTPAEPGTGLSTPIGIEEELRNFLAGGNFGTVDPRNPSSGSVNALFSAATDGIASRSLLTDAMTIYYHNNDMGTTKRVTDEMRQYLPTTLATLAARDPGLNKKGEPKQRFDANNFRYVDLVSIVSLNANKKEAYPADVQLQMDAKVGQLTTEQHRLSDINQLAKAGSLSRKEGITYEVAMERVRAEKAAKAAKKAARSA